jgi:poly(A) polymerase
MASAATPDEVLACFEHATAVGKAFGTIVVRAPREGARVDVELTSFRSEHGSLDHRHPESLRFGASVEEDSLRRDFTCNALYLDPLSDELRDPHGGLADLTARVLRTVGEPERRFEEDGLRLLRMARFAAQLELELAPGLLEAARARAQALDGVSPERVFHELERIFARHGAARALRLLAHAELLERALPRQAAVGASARPEASPAQLLELRIATLARLSEPIGSALGFALLYDPLEPPSAAPDAVEEALAAFDALRPPRALRHALVRTWRALEALALYGAAHARGAASRAAAVRLVREPEFTAQLALARAWGAEREQEPAALAELEAFARSAEPNELRPHPFIASGDLIHAGVRRGPLWGALLEEAEDLQLEGVLASRSAALSWLAARAQDLNEGERAQLGGKRRRKK